MSELKACPFCGGTASILVHPIYEAHKPYSYETAEKKYYAQCDSCATQCGCIEYPTEQEAADAWNRRNEPNEALTVEELLDSNMLEKPIYIVDSNTGYGSWGINKGTNAQVWLEALHNTSPSGPYTDFHLLDLVVYRHKPEGSEGE